MINIYIDSNVIVSSEIRAEEHHQESKKFMNDVLSNRDPTITFSTSVFTFLELASAMIRRTHDKNKTYSLLYRIKKLMEIFNQPSATNTTKKYDFFYEVS